ncbi:MAG: universal stress protein [Gammaproteobacteria bacterium]|nr:universal stress protein [Gammaproteobacteria bacterium]MBT8110483.1 universal stress protein [Gammaproteobacteria bacterium]NND47345.1 universal stress protein [Woeseiaceae bacterium]NNL45183.1 universal stress protein [Woeseiaceae bacterium]
MSRTVLCVIEFDNYPKVVVARAAWLAKRNNCELELLVSDPVPRMLSETYTFLLEAEMIADSIRSAQDERMEALVESAEAAGVVVHQTTSKARSVVDMVRARAARIDPLFVVKGTHFHSPSERASLAHTDWQLIRKLEAPLWFVKPNDWKDKPVIVAAVDPMNSHDKPARLDHKIVKLAQDIAAQCGGKLQVLHTYQRLDAIGSRAMKRFKPVKLPIDEIDKKIRNEHRQALDAFAKKCGLPEDAVHQLPGRAHELLPAFARSNGASLVVMGALARTGLKRRNIGSTAAKVLDHLPCDVLVVHS